MSQNITFNGQGYVIPDLGEINWGQNLTDFFVSIPAGALQPTGGGFTLTSEVDFGGAFGLKSLYFKSRTTNPAAAGVVRLANADTISFRNAGNTADLTLGVNGSNQLTFNGVVLESDTLPSGDMFVGDASNSSTPRTISGAWTMSNLGVATLSNNYIMNSMINASAAIAYSKLNLSLSIVNADISASAAIAYSKLNLATSIVNADVSASAAIAYSKLNLSSSIVNADVAAGAAIALNKLATMTDSSRMAVSDASGYLASSAWVYVTAGDHLRTGSQSQISFRDGTTNYVHVGAPSVVSTHTYLLPIAAGSAGQVLSWQTGGQLQWINAAGGGTINSGTTGRFAYYTGATTLSDSALFTTDGTDLTIASGRLIVPVGSAANPTIVFTGSLNHGFFWAANRIGVSIAGTQIARFGSDGLILGTGTFLGTAGSATLPTYSFAANDSTGWWQSSSGRIDGTINGTNLYTFSATQLTAATRVSIENTGDAFYRAITTGSGNASYIQFTNSTPVTHEIGIETSTDSGGGRWPGGANSLNLSTGGAYPISFSTDAVLRSQVSGAGSWGFFTTSFTIQSGSSLTELIECTDSVNDRTVKLELKGGSNSVYSNLNGPTIKFSQTAGSAGVLYFKNNVDANVLVLQQNGRVGINTSDLSANHALNIDASGYLGMRVLSTSVSSAAYLYLDNGTHAWSMATLGTSTGSPNQMHFAYDGTFKFGLSSSIITVDIPIQFNNGSESSPSMTFQTNNNTGFYRGSVDKIYASCGGFNGIIFEPGTSSVNTNQTTMSFLNGPIGVTTRIGHRSSQNVTTSAVQIMGIEQYCSLVWVAGIDGSAIFGDLVFTAFNVATPVVIASRGTGSPAARTYTQSGSELRLQMGSGTYDVTTMIIEQRTGSF